MTHVEPKENSEIIEMGTDIDSPPLIRQKSIVESTQVLMNDQDFQQKLSMVLTLALELYRVVMSTLLIVFVPQKCGDEPCSIDDKLYTSVPFEQVILSSNFITFVLFIGMYAIEAKRELCLINYMDTNRFKPRNNDAVAIELQHLSPKRFTRIESCEYWYGKLGNASFVAFLINVVLSSIGIFNSYLDSKTMTVLLTNVLFMCSKLYSVYSVLDTKPFILYSAYMTRKTQFNDVDPDKVEPAINEIVTDKSSPDTTMDDDQPIVEVSTEAETNI